MAKVVKRGGLLSSASISPFVLLSSILIVSAGIAQGPRSTGNVQPSMVLAERPPMGWNSWDAYGLTITESQFRENIEVQSRTLRAFGWNYAVIDEGWFLKNPLDRPTPEKLIYDLDANGRYIPVPERFPSALEGGENKGFAALGAYVHSLGLRFGIHIVRGIPRESVARDLPIAGSHFKAQDAADTTDACPWDPTNWGVRDTPAGQAWYDSLLVQYAAWGVDYLKVDCIADHPFKPTEILMLHRAILKSGRPIVLSLSPGPTSPGIATQVAEYAQMWRISDDVWDYWKNKDAWPRTLYGQFELEAAWSAYSHAGSWPDADMLPVGYLGPFPGIGDPRDSRLTQSEQRMMVTLWSIARSPLIVGANLTKLDDWTTKLLTNREVLDVNQFGHDQRQVAREGDIVAWTSAGKDGARYLALFNLSDSEVKIKNTFGFYNLPSRMYRARELWTGAERPLSDNIDATLSPHSCLLFKLMP